MTPDLLLAQYDIGRIAIYCIIVAAIVGIALVVIRQSGVTIPPFVITILWILAAAVLGVLLIKFLLGLV